MTPVVTKVGILLRTKNRNVTLERALSGITSQTFGAWHIHLLNDGGNVDAVHRTVAKYATELDGRITVYDNAISVGRGGALSQLLKTAPEPYVLIHDDDDTIEPVFLATTVSFLDDAKNTNCVAVVTSNFDVYANVDDDGVKIKSIIDTRGKKDRSYIDIMSFIGAEFGLFPPIACLFKKEAAMPYLCHIEDMNYHEDKALFSYMLLRGEFATIDNQISSYYHYDSENQNYLQTSYMNKRSGITEINNWFRDYVSSENGMSQFVCLLQNERRQNDHLRQIMIASHNGIIENISTTKEENKKNMNLIVQIIQRLNEKIDILEKKIQ